MSRNPAGPRALIVEADPETARNLSLLLSQWEYQTKWATSSWQALEMINQWRPHVALIDAGLPVTNGWQLAKIVRGRFSIDEVKLLILAERKTVAPPEHERVYDALLLKPVVIQKLRESLQSCATAS
jgi:CheY-like chemotaxis protein